MEIVIKKIDEITPYEKNPRKNDEAVEYVANSIKEFGFKVPIVIDKNGIIVAGHTRHKAAKKLGLKEVPCIIADDLTDEQIKAYRLADNKVSEKADWDFDLLDNEILDLDFDMTLYGFDDTSNIEWDNVDEISEEKYEEPEHDMLECPKCHHIDRKIHFKKIVSSESIIEEAENEDIS